jgi:hypothetical protein
VTTLVAAFPMYQRAELRPAFDALWAATCDLLRAQGIDAPQALTIVEDELLSFWQRPDLLLSHTCGFPFRHFLKDRVALVGTPDFGLEGCAPGYYRSALVVRRDDPRQSLSDFQGATIACNDLHSQSGHAAPMVAAHRAGIRFGQRRMSGAHICSARMVASGQADVAGLDAVSWRQMTIFDPWVSGLRVLDWTEPTPGLPFITGFAPLAPTIGDCLDSAIGSMPASMRDLLTLKRIVHIDAAHYLKVADPPANR